MLEESRSSLEARIDKSVRSNRKTADVELQKQRSESDSLLKSQNLKNSVDPLTEQQELQLSSERKLADEVQQKERHEADHFRQTERRQKKLIAESLLQAERSVMDLDLSNERLAYDTEAMNFASQLLKEQSLHDQTQSSLSNRGRFLAIVSHDLKNPLGSISMSAELIRTSLQENDYDVEDLIRMAGIIERNAATMQRLVDDLLDVERISRDKLTIQPKSQTLVALFEECKDLFLPIGESKSVSISMKISDKIQNIPCYFDYDRILQVLSNLIGNALKFTPPGGAIVVDATESESMIDITVCDNGPGIPEQECSRIFDRFSQLHSNDLRGLGLGLYISKWIVEAHHGNIGVQSAATGGSSFSFQLPRNPF